MDKEVNDELVVNLDVGTMAVIVIVVVTTCSVMTLFSLYCWNLSSSHTRIYCARCHQAIGVQGLPLPPQTAPPVPRGARLGVFLTSFLSVSVFFSRFLTNQLFYQFCFNEILTNGFGFG